jgi:hypothetical protein
MGAMAAALLFASSASAATVFSRSSTEGVEFTLTETDSSHMTLTMVGTLGGDWSTATRFDDFALNAIGNPALVTATLHGTSTNATSTGGGGLNNGQGSAGCSGSGNFYCFNYFPPGITVTGGGAINLQFDLVASGTGGFSFDGSTDPHLKVFFSNSDGTKVGSLYSEDLALGGGNTGVPEPATWVMMLVGVGMIGGVMRSRRKMATAAA